MILSSACIIGLIAVIITAGTAAAMITCLKLKKTDGAEKLFLTKKEGDNETSFIVSSDWKKIYYTSPSYSRLFCIDAGQIRKSPLSWLDSVHPDDKDPVKNALSSTIKTSYPPEFPKFRITCTGGSVHWIAIRQFPIKITGGKIERLAVIADDITDSKLAFEELKKREENYSSIMSNIQDVFYRSDSQGKLIMISPSVRRILGYDSAEECIGMNIAQELYYSPSDRDKFISLLRENGRVSDYETTLRRKDGSPVVVSTSSHFYFDEKGKITGIEGVVRDITERKRAEDMLNKAFNENPCPMSISDISTGFYIEVNKAWLEALEFQKDEVIGRTALELNIYRNIKERDKIVDAISTTGHAHNLEFEFVSKTGQSRYGIFFGEIIDVASKKMLLSSVLNITGQRKAENQLKALNEELAAANEELKASNEEFEAMNQELISANEELAVKEKELRDSEAKYRTLVDNLSAGIIIYDINGIIIFSNRTAAKMLGLSVGEMLGSDRKNNNWDVIGEDGSPIVLEKNPHLLTITTGKPVKNFILGIRNPDRAERIWLLCNTYPVRNQDGSLIQVVTTFIDLTERKIAEEEARRLKNYLNNIIDSNPDMLIGINSEMRITLINRKTETFAGIEMKDAAGKHLEIILPDFTPAIQSMHAQIVNSQPVSNPGFLLEKNGEKRYYNLTLYPLVSTGIEGAVIIIIDVTDLIKKEEQLRQAQKMETVGTLAGGLAHDFNNVLSGIVGTTSLIMHLIEKDKVINERFKNYIDVIDKSGNRAAEMVQQLLTLSRKTEISLIPLDLKKSLQNVVQVCRNTFDKSIEIHTEFSDLPAIINGDPSQMEQVFLNLCINASHAMTIMRKENEKHGGNLTLSIRKIIADKHFCSTHPEASAGKYWVISQSDTGVGINAGDLHKIFDPFFTTKERDSGTGLGLAMVYSIVHNHGGFIDVYSEPGTGSTFNIYFPELADNEAREVSEQEFKVERGEGLILVIDDEEIVRLTAESILIECGYDVIIAGSGREGLSIFRERKDEIKCVILDMAMPVMSGKEVYIELKKIDPGVKVLLASGFRQDGRVQETLALGVDRFIQKPYSITELSKKIKDLN